MRLFPGFVDRRFAQFCRSGDPKALGDVFDLTSVELLRVACFLVGQRADAEDLVQRTFVSAIEGREAFRPGARALPWLIGILANHGKQLQRRRRRREPSGEAVVADPAALACERELHERVVALRAELGAPYGEVIQLHFEHGLSAKEIAATLQRPAGTVRTQLVRALELLRRRLPDGFVAGGAVALLIRPSSAVGASLATMRGTIVRAAERLAPPAASVPLTLFGSLLVTKKFAALASLLFCAALVGSWLSWPSAASRSAAVADAAQVAPAVAMAATGAVVGPSPSIREPAHAVAAGPTASRDRPDPGFATVRVIVRWSGEHPAVGIGVFAANGRLVDRRDAVTGSDGVAVLPHLPPGIWRIDTTLGHGDPLVAHDPAAGIELELAADEERTVEVGVGKLATASGRVVDAADRPVADARIWLSLDRESAVGHEVARSDDQGGFRVPILGAHFLGARKLGFAPSRMTIVNPLNAAEPIVLRLLHPGGSLRGFVRDASGAPVAFAKILVGEETTRCDAGEDWSPRGVEVSSQRDGAFACDGVPLGRLEVRAWAAGFAPFRGNVEIAARGSAELGIVLERGARLVGKVCDQAGAPVAGATVRWQREHEFATAVAISDTDGSYELGDLPGGAQLLLAERGGARAVTRLMLLPAATNRWDATLSTQLAILGRIVDAAGRGLPDLDVCAWRGDVVARSCTDADGRFALREVGAEPVMLEVSREMQSLLQQPAVSPGRDDVELRLTDADLLNAFVVGRIVDERGQPVAASIMAWRRDANRAKGFFTDADGRYRIGPVRSGSYALDVSTETLGRATLPRVDLAPHETRDLGDFVMATPGRATITVTMLGGPAATGTVRFARPDSGWGGSAAIESGVAEHRGLPPGAVWVTAESQGLTQSAALEIVAGAHATVTLDLQPTHRATITAVGVTASIDRAELPRLVARRPDGTFAGAFHPAGAAGPLEYWVDLPAGIYTLTATGGSGQESAVTVDLRAGAVAATLALPGR